MESEGKILEPACTARRLCGEIKLFNLCDLGRCGFKKGGFCTDPDMLARFEDIADEDDSVSGVEIFDDAEDGDAWDDDGVSYSDEAFDYEYFEDDKDREDY